MTRVSLTYCHFASLIVSGVVRIWRDYGRPAQLMRTLYFHHGFFYLLFFLA